MEILLEPFAYSYMTRAILVSALVGALCGALSAFLVLKGWSLMGSALSCRGAGSRLLRLPAILSPSAPSSPACSQRAALRWCGADGAEGRCRDRPDLHRFFALGLLIVSLRPTSVSVQTIAFGNILAISDTDIVCRSW